MRFDRILYVDQRLGGASRSLCCSLEIARDHGASLTVAAVVGGGGAAPVLARWRRAVERRAGRLRGGVGVTVRVLRAGEVADATAEHDLVVAVADRGSLRWPLRYAPAERALIRGAGCPVWILHPAQQGPVRVVLAAVDVSPHADEERARRVVRTAAGVAAAAGAELHVLHALSVPGESLIRSLGRGGSPRGLERVLRAEAADRGSRLRRLLALEDVRPQPRVLLRRGRVIPTIEAVAWQREADLVVVGASADRDGIGRIAFPPTAEQIVGRVHASVAVVQTDAGPRPAVPPA